jgi:peptidoglycan/LPS O-acetylase OafA/YrhL
MSLTYRPEIDGLRAIAVTAVILFHSGLVPLHGGFAGVDVFFVISGYLVTGILLKDLGNGTHSILRFYERRVRRILPALAVVLAATTLAAWALMIPPQLESYSKSLLAVLLFVSNLLFGANSGYFSPALEEAPLLHTWSLSIEEQYYLLFPLVLAQLLRRGPRTVTWGLWGMALASLALAQWGAIAKPEFNFFFSLSRFWELLAGSVAAWISHRRVIAAHGPAALLGLALILAAVVLHSDRTPYPSVYALMPVAGSVLVILFAGQGNLTGRLLSLPPMMGIGLISYSAYLWHQPLFAFARIAATDAPAALLMWAMTAMTFVLAWISWRWIEQPFRRQDRRWLRAPRWLFGLSALAMAGLVLIGSLGMISAGNATFWRSQHPEQAVLLDIVLAAGVDSGLPADDGSCRFNLTNISTEVQPRLRDCARRFGPAAVVLGDSHGIDMFKALHAAADAPFLLGLTNGGCRPADANADCPFDGFLTLARAEPQLFRQVLFVQAGPYLLTGPDGRAGSRQLFARASAHQPLPAFGVNAVAVSRIATYLRQIVAAGVPVIWASPRIEPHISANRVLRLGCTEVPALRPGQIDAFVRLDDAIRTAAATAGASHLPLAAYGFDIAQDFMSCDTLYWSDGDHWSTAGELRFGTRLLPRLPTEFQ